MRTRTIAILPVALVLGLLSARTALAAWPNQPSVNLKLCGAANSQVSPTIVSDGAGGAIVTWQDSRGGGIADIYAQRVLASGGVDPAWTAANGNANGTPLCIAVSHQVYPTIVSDGTGGAIVTWQDLRGGTTYDIYAQHVLASGVVAPAWTAANGNANGTPLCIAAGDQSTPMIISDGAGGAIVTWNDLRTPANGYDIYAQHVLASGVVDPAWTANGTLLCNAPIDQTSPTIVSDGAGGAIVTWQDFRSNTTQDIYAQHVMASGVVDPAWTANGTLLCNAANSQYSPTIVSDGAGGAIVTWYDLRIPANGYDIYARHVLASGVVDPAWTANGTLLCNAASDQLSPTIVSDGAGGAIVTWNDYRGGATSDIYAQHVMAAGVVDPAWTANGTLLCNTANDQQSPTIVADGAGGAIVTWYDYRGGATSDIYAQHVMAAGVVDPAWTANGTLLSNATNLQQLPTIVSDGAGGAIVTWQDLRNGAGDIYAQRIARFGYLGTPEAEITGVKDVPNDQGGKVKLSWNASYLDLASNPNLFTYDIWRSVPPNVAAYRLRHGERPLTSLAEAGLEPGRLLITREGVQSFAWEYVDTQPAFHYITIYSYLAPTAEDSTGAGYPRTAFMVVARNSANTMYWLSRPDSGYSVDNLGPVTPAPFTGAYSAGATHLHWGLNHEVDLAGYRLYRGGSSGFIPGPGNLVSAQPDTGFGDVGPAGSYYKLSAVDVHGNESAFALLTPGSTLDAGGVTLPRAVALAAPRPNPASVQTMLSFALPEAGPVRLAVYDMEGRRVRTVSTGRMEAGEHQFRFDLRDDRGHQIASGIYFVRLEAHGRTLMRRLAIVE